MSFTHVGTSTPLINANTLDNGSVVFLTERLATNERLVINKEWIEDHILPAITAGTGAKEVWIGFQNLLGNPDWTNGINSLDFAVSYQFYCDDAIKGK